MQVGTPKDLYEDPESKFVADFIGKSNFIECRILDNSSKDAKIEIAGKPLNVPSPGKHIGEIKEKPVIVARPEYIKVCVMLIKGVLQEGLKRLFFTGNYVQYDIRFSENLLRVEAYCPQEIKIYSPGSEVGINFDLNSIRVLENEI